MAQSLKCLPATRETQVRPLGWEDPLEKEMATHSNILAWRIPWTEEPGRLQSVGSQSQTRLSDFMHSLIWRLSCFSHGWLFVTPWTAARQAPLSMGLPRQEYWSGLPFLPPVDLPDPGIQPVSLTSLALAGVFFAASTTWEAYILCFISVSPFWRPCPLGPRFGKAGSAPAGERVAGVEGVRRPQMNSKWSTGPVAKTPCFQFRGPGLDPQSGN